jgi:hypothetical protein
MTVLPRQSKKKTPNLHTTHLYGLGAGLLDFPVSPSSNCGPIGDAARLAPSQPEWKRPFTPMMMKPPSYVGHM